MKQTIVGAFRLGHHPIQIVIREDNGGEFYFEPELGEIGRIKVGVDCAWIDVVDVLLHELVEYWLADKGKRYNPTSDSSASHDTYLFCFSHPDLSIMTHDVGVFIAESLPSIGDAYKKWHAKKKK